MTAGLPIYSFFGPFGGIPREQRDSNSREMSIEIKPQIIESGFSLTRQHFEYSPGGLCELPRSFGWKKTDFLLQLTWIAHSQQKFNYVRNNFVVVSEIFQRVFVSDQCKVQSTCRPPDAVGVCVIRCSV